MKEKQNKVKINSSEHYESGYRRAEDKRKGFTSTERKTGYSRGESSKASAVQKGKYTQSIQESNKIDIISHSRFIVKPRTSTGEVEMDSAQAGPNGSFNTRKTHSTEHEMDV